MLSIPEIATQLIDKTLTNVNEINSRTIFLVGSKSVVSDIVQCILLNSLFVLQLPQIVVPTLSAKPKRSGSVPDCSEECFMDISDENSQYRETGDT